MGEFVDAGPAHGSVAHNAAHWILLQAIAKASTAVNLPLDRATPNKS